MNQRAATFEIASIATLLLIGMSLSALQIDGTGILSVAGLLSLFFVTSHHKALLRLSTHFGTSTPWPSASANSTSET